MWWEEDVSHMDIWSVIIAGNGDNKDKDPEVGACLACFRFTKETSVAGAKQRERESNRIWDHIDIERSILGMVL